VAAIDGVRFGHVNVTSRDWRRLASFYTDVFGCEFVPPERDIRSADLDGATGLTDAHLTGAHLRLPGLGETGPTIEIFSYDEIAGHPGARVDRPGWGHIAFQVPDVPAALQAVADAGGGRFGEIVRMQTRDGRQITWVYATVPDGNLIELQAWSPAPT
jgi:catechol 2,3-dioxygenase-like lactoylglutathione lyase family enzyme